MLNIWSRNSIVNNIVNILLFLMGVNLFHLGQLFLPIICFVLFIDSKFKFKVNNIIVFITLIMFSVAFFAFSYELGFYCVMGFCLPMAYYIGSNINDPTEDNIRKIVYLLIFSMGIHVILNFAYDYSLRGIGLFSSYSHFDIWTRDKISATSTAVNFNLLMAVLYCLIRSESNLKIKIFGIVEVIVILIYNIGLGRRTPILILIISVITGIIYDLFNKRNNKKYIKKVLRIVIVLLFSLSVFILISKTGWFIDMFGEFLLYKKFSTEGIQTTRLTILFEAIKLSGSHLWGLKEISKIIGEPVHEILFDIYDYSGIVPFCLFLIYETLCFKNLLTFFFNKNISRNCKKFFILVVECIIIVFVLEPVMTGASIFLIISVLIFALIEKLSFINTGN